MLCISYQEKGDGIFTEKMLIKKHGTKEKEVKRGWAVDCMGRPGGISAFLSSSKKREMLRELG